MEQLTQTTFVQQITDLNASGQDRLLILSQEAASVYNSVLDIFWNNLNNKQKWLSAYDLQAGLKLKRVQLSSDSYIGSIQQFAKAVSAWKKAKTAYAKNPKKFCGQPKPPTEHKRVCPIVFKRECIRYKNGYLLLSLARKLQPIKIRWNPDIGVPIYATINWNTHRGWQGNFVFEHSVEQQTFDVGKILGVDLGVKRIATTFDGEKAITYSGKLVMSLVRLRNKIDSSTQKKLSKLKKHSRRYKTIRRANRKVINRIQNRITDILHKISRTIVNYCVENGIGKIVFGDCSTVHVGTNTGKENNQKIQQHPEQKLLKYISYKLESIGGLADKVQESYTTRTCPKCGNQYKPGSRTYRCQKCGFVYDRDGVGSINIWGLAQNVSLGKAIDKIAELGVVGGLTPPIGWKHRSSQLCVCKPRLCYSSSAAIAASVE